MNANQKNKVLIGTTLVVSALLTVVVIVAVLMTIPVKNRMEGNVLTVEFVVGKKVIDLTDARFKRVPEEVKGGMIRTCGTSIGRVHSGNFKNRKSGNRYKFYLTGKGGQTYFEIDGTRYLVDGIEPRVTD